MRVTMARNRSHLMSHKVELFNEAEVAVDDPTLEVDAEPEMETVTYTRKARSKRKPLPENLPRERHVIDLPEVEKIC